MKHNNLFFLGALCISMALHGAADDDRSLTSFTPQELQEHAAAVFECLNADGWVSNGGGQCFASIPMHVAPFVMHPKKISISDETGQQKVVDSVLAGYFFGKRECKDLINAASKICVDDTDGVLCGVSQCKMSDFSFDGRKLHQALYDECAQFPEFITHYNTGSLKALFFLFLAEDPDKIFSFNKCTFFTPSGKFPKLITSNLVVGKGPFIIGEREHAANRLMAAFNRIDKKRDSQEKKELCKAWVKNLVENRTLDSPYLMFVDPTNVAQLFEAKKALINNKGSDSSSAKHTKKPKRRKKRSRRVQKATPAANPTLAPQDEQSLCD